jgi:uncharacterized delta-60 repeat protein
MKPQLVPGTANGQARPAAISAALLIMVVTVLRAEVTLDGSFSPTLAGSVWTVAVQPGGKILIGGSFEAGAGAPRTNLARLNLNGTVDATFNPSLPSSVYSIHTQSDGGVLVGGGFAPAGIARLDSIGRQVSGFPAAPAYVSSPVPEVGGSILVFGGYKRIQRLDGNGELVASFPVPGWGEDQDVYVLAVQADGKILAGGEFGARGILRLNADGSPDTGFNPQWDGQKWVEALCEQADGKILIAGDSFPAGQSVPTSAGSTLMEQRTAASIRS